MFKSKIVSSSAFESQDLQMKQLMVMNQKLQREVRKLEAALELATLSNERQTVTRNKSGVFSDSVRECVLELVSQ